MTDPKLKLGTRFCLCSACGRYFGGISGFDLHRREGACLAPETLTNKDGERLLFLSASGYWSGKVSKDAFVRGAA